MPFFPRSLPRSVLPGPASELEAAPATPEAFAGRLGYRPDFLGTQDAFLLPLPLLKDTGPLVPVLGAPPERPFELRYENFSVAIHGPRRLCCITAVNIDGGAPFFHPKRPGWRFDPRLPQDAQLGGPDFYEPTSFDRGHMVRRLDPLWGSQDAALRANADTHHYPNACPQVHSFNDTAWGNLEDWILSQEQTLQSRGSVFTAPLLQDSDPLYLGVRVPVEFFKIIAVIDSATGTLSVTAFSMDQSAVLPPRHDTALFDPGPFVVNQVTVAELEARSGLDFGLLKTRDVLARLPLPATLRPAGPRRVLLRSVRDAILWAP